MKHQNSQTKESSRHLTQHSRAFLVALRSFALAGILIANNVFVLVQPSFAAQTAAAYCGQYTTTTLKNACRGGVSGEEDCNDYALIADQAAVDICNKAAKDREAGLVTPGEVTVTPSPSPSASPSAEESGSDNGANPDVDLDQVQGLLDQANSLSDYIDILHQAGPDSAVNTDEIADDNYGYYINGAGKKQSITVNPSGQPNSPVILFFNGGGWHANDHTSDKVADDAKARGYTVMDVTYRLGSSGVYYMFEDVMRGIQHVHNNADLYGVDANKLAIWGDSAGGSLSMRAAASGRSGAKAAVGWSAPTNAYTALFKSIQSMAIGIDHSTCAPTDLAGFANFANLASGGSGDIAEYGQGLSSNDVSALGIGLDGAPTNADPLSLLTQGLVAGRNLLSTGQDTESISSSIISSNGDMSGLSGSTFNLASKKFVECLDNFNALSPALFASPDSSPSFLAGFEDDGLIDPSQSYGMRDKLRQLGIHSDALILPGGDECMQTSAAPAGAGGCHLGYFKAFVCQTLNFVDSEIQPDKGATDCATGVSENQGSNDAAAAASGGSGSGSQSGSSGSQSGPGSGGSQQKAGDSCTTSDGKSGVLKDPSGAHGLYCSAAIDDQKAACSSAGSTWVSTAKGGGYCQRPTSAEQAAGYYTPSYEKTGSTGRYTCPKGGTFTQDPTKGNICKL